MGVQDKYEAMRLLLAEHEMRDQGVIYDFYNGVVTMEGAVQRRQEDRQCLISTLRRLLNDEEIY